MSAPAIAVLYRFAYNTLGRNLEGVTDAESVIPPGPAGNCANWLVGHLLWTRDFVHGLLGLDPAWPAQLGSSQPYSRGSTGFVAADAIALTKLREALASSQDQVMTALGNIGEARLAERATDTQTVGERLAFLGFHEGYHVGQIGLVRRLLGKAGAIP